MSHWQMYKKPKYVKDDTQGAKIFGPAKPLLLRVAIASPCDKRWSCHNASACG